MDSGLRKIACRGELSLVIPIHNEELILRENIQSILNHLDTIDSLDDYEVILVCNGCEDSSEEICSRFSGENRKIRSLAILERGLGRAISAGAEAARYEMIMFYAIDLPFGLSIINESVDEAYRSGSVVIGSKGHRDSRGSRGLARRSFSFLISMANRLLLGLEVADSQGSVLFYKETVRRFARFMDDPGAFFQAQILLYSLKSGFTLREIPVELKKEIRKTRFRLVGDGVRYLCSIIRERAKLARMA